MIAAGTLDRRVTIEALTESQSGSGGLTQSWAAVATVWCGFRPLAGREGFVSDAAQRAAFADALFTMRYNPGLTLSPKTHRVVLGGRPYDIVSVAQVSRGETVEVAARARAE